MLVAVSGNRIVGGLGFVGYQAEFVKHSSQLGMSIQQIFANSGLGTEMMKYTIELAKGFGFHRIDLSVRTYNEPGIALYEKVGLDFDTKFRALFVTDFSLLIWTHFVQ